MHRRLTVSRCQRARTLPGLLILAAVMPLASRAAASAIPLGGAANYGVLFEGAGGNMLSITNVTANGNIGIGGTGTVKDSGPSTINGRIDFAAGNTGQLTNSNGSNIISGGVYYNVAAVTAALNTINTLSTTLGNETGTALSVNLSGTQTQTINASAGVLDASGDRVFTVSKYLTTSGNTLIINGDAAGDNVVLNFGILGANFYNQVSLTGGLTSDQVLYNLNGGGAMEINDNASGNAANVVKGIFLDPTGSINFDDANVNGRVFGGDSITFKFIAGSTLIDTSKSTFYNLAAGITGGNLTNGRLTQGQSANLTASITNTGNGTADTLDYTGLNITGQSLSPTSGGPIGQGSTGTASGTFTAAALGNNTFTPVGNGTNATFGGNATLGNASNATVYVDALAQHVNATGLTDTGNASTTPTAFYRQKSIYGGNNLGNVTIVKETTGKYNPAFANNLNGGLGYDHGMLTITATGADNQFGSDESIILLGFHNVRYGNTSNGNLITIEAALTSAGISWQDMSGNKNNWTIVPLAGQVDPLNGTGGFRAGADYDLELGFVGPYSSSGVSYFDFNFAGELGTAGNVVNIMVIPEPSGLMMVLFGGLPCFIGLRPQRQRRLTPLLFHRH